MHRIGLIENVAPAPVVTTETESTEKETKKSKGRKPAEDKKETGFVEE